MFVLILAELLTATSSSPSMLPLAEVSVATDAPATRKVCRDEKLPNSRFMRRVCTVVKAKQVAVETAPQTPIAPVAPVMTTFGIGMDVVDGQGVAVGVLTAVAADSVTVKTDRHQAQLPKSSLTISDGKALFGMTQAELNASVEKSLASTATAALAIGAEVKGKGGTPIGTVDSATGDSVTIKLAGGQKISIPRSGIAIGADGSGTIGITAAELEAQVRAVRPAG